MEAISPQAFHEKIAPVMGANPYWMGVSQASHRYDDITAPDKGSTFGSTPWYSSFKSAVKTSFAQAVRYANPLSIESPTAQAIGIATAKVEENSAKLAAASASTLQAAQGGIKSGFRWVTIALIAIILLYVLSWIYPFIPKNRS